MNGVKKLACGVVMSAVALCAASAYAGSATADDAIKMTHHGGNLVVGSAETSDELTASRYCFTGKAGFDGLGSIGANASMACWVKLAANQGSGGFFNAGACEYEGFTLYTRGYADGKCGFCVGKNWIKNNGVMVEAVVPHDGTWHHLAGVHDGTNGRLQLYVDGELRSESSSVQANVTCGAVCINFRSGHGSLAVMGGYGELKPHVGITEGYIYKRALTAAEVRRLYEGVYPISAEDQIVYWPLHQLSGEPTAYYADGKERSLQATGQASWAQDEALPGASNFVYDVRTSSRRFTNGGQGATGMVGLYVLAIPEGMTKYQVTTNGATPAAADWAACATVADLPETISFARPSGEADLAWTLHFANSDLSVVSSRPMNSLRYTAVEPVLIRSKDSYTMMIEAEGIDNTVEFATYDNGSHGGQSTGAGLAPLGIPVAERRLEYNAGPQVDQDDDFNTVTFNRQGDYALDFNVVNAAGTVVTNVVALTVEQFDQLDHWVYANGKITDGCFTFKAAVVNADAKTIKCGELIVDDSNYPPTRTAPLDFSKPVWNDGDHAWKVTVIQKIGSDTFIPHSPAGYEWDCVLSSLAFHPDTTTIGNSTLGTYQNGGNPALWKNVRGRIVVPAGVTSIGQYVFGCFKAQELVFEAPDGVSIGSQAISYSSFTNIAGRLRGNIQGTTIRYVPLNCPLDLTGVTTLSNAESLRDSSCPWAKISTNLTNWSAIYFFPAKMSGFPGGLTSIGGSIGKPRFVKEDGVTDVGLLDLAGMTSLGDSKLSGTSGYGDLCIPETLKTVGSSTFWNTSITNVTIADGGLATSVGARAFTSKDLKTITFLGAPPATMDANFLGASDGKTTLITNMQVTVFVPLRHAAAWRALADDETIPGTITKGSTQKIRFFGTGFAIIIR